MRPGYAITAVIGLLLSSCTSNEDILRHRATELCRYLPDVEHIELSKGYLTEDFYNAVEEMVNLPDKEEVLHEWEFYFVAADGSLIKDTDFEVTDVTITDSVNAVASITITPVDTDNSTKRQDDREEHYMRLRKVNGRWLVSDFDDMKQYCHKYIARYFTSDPEYSEPAMWYISDNGCEADIFYICSTETNDWIDPATNLTVHTADVNNMLHRKDMYGEMHGADSLFRAAGCNFYSPYYRQATIEGLLHDTADFMPRTLFAADDVARAFNYYIDSLNNGRPFVLMGYSQGGLIALHILKNIKHQSDVMGRMVATYIIGYKLTATDKSHPNIRLAQCASDLGVTVCFNSVASPKAAISVISGGTKAGINPANWRTDSEPATFVFDYNGANDTLTAVLDTVSHLVLISGYKGSCPQVPFVGKEGNYHCMEIPLYYKAISANIALRTTNYRISL